MAGLMVTAGYGQIATRPESGVELRQNRPVIISPVLEGGRVHGSISPEDYGASGSAQHTTATATTTAALVLTAPIDFHAPLSGQTPGVLALGLGAAFTAGAPISPAGVFAGKAGAAAYQYKFAACGDDSGGMLGHSASTSMVTVGNTSDGLGPIAGAINKVTLSANIDPHTRTICIYRAKTAGTRPYSMAFLVMIPVSGSSFSYDDTFPDAYMYYHALVSQTPPTSSAANAYLGTYSGMDLNPATGAYSLTGLSPALTSTTTRPVHVTHYDGPAMRRALASMTSSLPCGRLQLGANKNYVVDAMGDVAACGIIAGAGDVSSQLLVLPDTADTLHFTSTSDVLIRDFAILPVEWSIKPGGYAIKASGQSHFVVRGIVHIAGYDGVWDDGVSSFDPGGIYFDQLLGTRGLRMRGTSGAPYVSASEPLGSTTGNVPNTKLVLFDVDSYMGGVWLTGANNMSGGGTTLLIEDSDGGHPPNFVDIFPGGDHPAGTGVEITAGSYIVLRGYQSSSLTGHGVRTSGTFKGGLTIAPGMHITASYKRGVSIEAGKGIHINGQIISNGSGSGGNDGNSGKWAEVYIASGITDVFITDEAMINNGAKVGVVSVTDGPCVALEGNNNRIVLAKMVTSGTVSATSGCAGGSLYYGNAGGVQGDQNDISLPDTTWIPAITDRATKTHAPVSYASRRGTLAVDHGWATITFQLTAAIVSGTIANDDDLTIYPLPVTAKASQSAFTPCAMFTNTFRGGLIMGEVPDGERQLNLFTTTNVAARGASYGAQESVVSAQCRVRAY
jgi:hypothetical protein